MNKKIAIIAIVLIIVIGGIFLAYEYNILNIQNIFNEKPARSLSVNSDACNFQRDKKVDLFQPLSCKFVVNNNLPPFTFEFVKMDQYSYEINVFKGKDLVQKIPDSQLFADLGYGSFPDRSYLSIETINEFSVSDDINFDGYKDISLTLGYGATGNRSVLFLLFDPVLGRFKPDEILGELINPSFDKEKKVIISNQYMGSAGCSFIMDFYKFESNGKYKLYKSIDQEFASFLSDRVIFKRITKELLDGKLKVFKEETITDKTGSNCYDGIIEY